LFPISFPATLEWPETHVSLTQSNNDSSLSGCLVCAARGSCGT